METFPAAFRADFAAWLASLREADPFDPEGRIEPLRPSTVAHYRELLHRFASNLVRAGVPAEQIVSVATLLDPEHARRGLRWMLERNGGDPSVGIRSTAQLLRNTARGYVRVPPEDEATLADLAKRVTPKRRQGLTEKNRRRLRPLQDEGTLRRLLQLPERLARRCRAEGPTRSAALRFEVAVAIAILLHCPIRVGNLASIHLEWNIHRMGDGRAFLVFGAEAVKNRQQIDFELPRAVVDLVDEHLARWQPLLCPVPTPWLFPKRDGAVPMVGNRLAKYVSRRIRAETGLEVNVHLFRHLAAMIWLDAHPGQYEVVRRLLGHSALSQTLNVYAGFEAGTATRLFSQLVERGQQA